MARVMIRLDGPLPILRNTHNAHSTCGGSSLLGARWHLPSLCLKDDLYWGPSVGFVPPVQSGCMHALRIIAQLLKGKARVPSQPGKILVPCPGRVNSDDNNKAFEKGRPSPHYPVAYQDYGTTGDAHKA